MKLAVIGEPCIDYIIRDGIISAKKLGGILYSVISLAVIAKKEDLIFPIMNLGEDEYDYIIDNLKKFKNIDYSKINKTNNKTRVVKLFYNELSAIDRNSYDREESSTYPASPIEYNDIYELKNILDGVLINLVSGVDISLRAMKQIGKEFKCYVHTDIHNLVMKTLEDGSRKRFPVENWAEWISSADTLQMNETELAALTGSFINEEETALKILTSSSRLKNLVLTRGNNGVSLLYLNNYSYTINNKIKRIDIPSIKTDNFIDSTGCGDVFGTAYFYKNLTNNFNYESSLIYANKIAGFKTKFEGAEELHKLHDLLN